MFARWLFVRLTAAEKALRNGRLDEAYQAFVEAEAREHQRGQQLLDDLEKQFLARVRVHAQAGRYGAALDDLNKLAQLGRNSPEMDALRQRATEEMRQKQARDAQRHETYQRASEDLQAGRLESGRLAIERVEDPQKRERLREQLDLRIARSEQVLDQAQAALEQGDVLAACRHWDEACRRHGRNRQSDLLAPRLITALRQALDSWLVTGKLDRFLAARPLTDGLRAFDPTLEEYGRLAAFCSQAAAQMVGGDYAGLRETLLRLLAARDGARWINDMLAAAAQIGDARERLLASPLGLLGVVAGRVEKLPGIGTANDRAARHNLSADTVGEPLGPAVSLGQEPLLMLVDGTGSGLILTRDRVRIGRAGSAGIDVPIPADLQSHHADIIRDGEDYFLLAYGPAAVNQRAVQRTLLRDGDRIVLGTKAKLMFHKPSAKSESATLKISDRCRLPQDVSHVILFRDTCLVGPQSNCHLRTREGDTQVVLFDRAGQLFVRQKGADGRPVGQAAAVEIERTRQFGDVRITVKPYRLADSGGRPLPLG